MGRARSVPIRGAELRDDQRRRGRGGRCARRLPPSRASLTPRFAATENRNWLISRWSVDFGGFPSTCDGGCAAAPCENGAACSHFLELVTGGSDWRAAPTDWGTAEGYTCSCQAGFSGTNCDADVDECGSSPCQNGGVCTDGSDAYTCACATYFSGDDCETEAIVQCTDGTTLAHSPTTCATQTYESCAYECDAGYVPSGSHVCGRDASMSGGSCAPRPCTMGLTPAHSVTTCDGATGDTCAYACEAGYSASGDHVCGADGSFSGGACEPGSCTGSLANSPTECSAALFDSCTFECDEGYTPAGNHRCQSTLVFAGGSCVANGCTTGLSIPNSPTTCSGSFGEECVFECDSTYTKIGSHVCGADGAFTGGCCAGPGTCCGTIENSPTSCSNVAQGAACEYVCDEGYQKAVGASHVCGANGQLSGAQCTPDSCIFGTSITSSPTTCSGSTGDVCSFTCNLGYDPSGSHVCGSDRWFRGGSCEIVGCESSSLANSPTTCSGSAGQSCDFTCDPGYSVAYNAPATSHRCIAATRSFDGGVCNPNPCTGGSTMAHMATPLSCTGVTGDVCVYTCDAGYTRGNHHVCLSTGSFSGGSCTATPCTSGLTIAGSDSVCSGAYGDECDYECRPGFTKGGSHTCGTDTSFAGGSCTPTPCSDGVVPDSTESPTCSGVTDDVCEYTCNDGYTAGGAHTCLASGQFGGGSCTAAPCSSGTTIVGSDTVCTSRTGETCAFTCRLGWTQSGTHTCGADGVMSGGSCTPTPCSESTPTRSTTTCTGSTEDACVYECEGGYEPSGSHVCGSDGAFAGGACVPLQCFLGTTIANSPDTCAGTNGDTCAFTCDAGYTPTGSHVCGSDRNFRGGSCTPVACTGGFTIANSDTVCSGATGDMCIYTCQEGFRGSGAHICRGDGDFWGGNCHGLPCLYNSSIANAEDGPGCVDGTTCCGELPSLAVAPFRPFLTRIRLNASQYWGCRIL